MFHTCFPHQDIPHRAATPILTAAFPKATTPVPSASTASPMTVRLTEPNMAQLSVTTPTKKKSVRKLSIVAPNDRTSPAND